MGYPDLLWHSPKLSVNLSIAALVRMDILWKLMETRGLVIWVSSPARNNQVYSVNKKLHVCMHVWLLF
jgi:hypothetical protein